MCILGEFWFNNSFLLLRILLHGNCTYTTTAEDCAKITGHVWVIGKGNILRL